MRKLEHENNTKWWQCKVGEATTAQVIEFARGYQRVDPSAWATAVLEGERWIAATHVKDVARAMGAKGATAVWVSDGLFGQCVWRREKEAVVKEVEG